MVVVAVPRFGGLFSLWAVGFGTPFVWIIVRASCLGIWKPRALRATRSSW